MARIFLAILENYPGLPDVTIQTVRGAEDKWVLIPIVGAIADYGHWRPLLSGTAARLPQRRRLEFLSLIHISEPTRPY